MSDLVERLRQQAAFNPYNTQFVEAADRIEQLEAALNYVADMTYCGTDAEWHFKSGYDPQEVLDALAQSSPPKATDCTCPVGMHSIGCHNR